MNLTALDVGFIPLFDAAPLICAHEMGFAQEEGLDLRLHAHPSWSSLRDKLCFGQLDAAHMLSVVPVASALGLGGSAMALHALSVLSVNGNVIGVSQEMAAKMAAAHHDFAFSDARMAGEALIAAAPEGLRIGVPFPFSMHAELVYYWLSALGLPAPQMLMVRTVPPAQMADALVAGEIDAFCVGEPWGSRAVEAGVGTLLLPCSAIWSFAPEKVLAVRGDWADGNRDIAHRLIRALWRAGRWLAKPESAQIIPEILSKQHYLNLPAELLEHALTGHFTISPNGETRVAAGFVEFFEGAATFPWRSQAEWIGTRLTARNGLDRTASAEAARGTFRSDIYRAALTGTAPNLPTASAKLEGAVETPLAAGSMGSSLILERNAFFDGRIFEPATP
ncbi:MAG: CmpA/NrtA family ABC transporter substrate-binding protein [Pseudomonadota bacterium]